jgi:hypothetical protein
MGAIEIETDYTRVRDWLQAGQWRQADEATRSLLRQLAGVTGDDFVCETHAIAFPCADLDRLDRWWRDCSEGRFGFSVQSHIWQQVGGRNPDANYRTWLRFGERVGWWRGCWIDDESKFQFDTNAPVGHLPAVWLEEWEFGEVLVSLFDRLDHCQIGEIATG